MEYNDFSNSFFNEADTTVTIKQMRKAIRANIKRKFANKDKEWIDDVTDKIMAKNGIDFDHFNFIKVIERVINEKLNDVSIDDNSNKNEKTIEGIFSEANATVKKTVGYDFLYRTMKELYGKSRAKRLAANMYDYSIILSDSTNILKPYCWALDSSKLLTIGRPFGQLPSGPCNRISSYISALTETLHGFASTLAGACAVGDFMPCIAHLAYYKMKLNYEELFTDKCRKHFINEFQQFVHSVNHLSRNGVESPFTNVSIFDKVKLKYFVSTEIKWMFPIPEDWNKTKEEWEEYIVNYIYEVQNIFLDFFDKGDPLNNGRPYRFPVVTACMSKTVEGELKVEDKEFLNDITKREIHKYNIFMSEGSKIASCCRLVNDNELFELGGAVNSFGSGALSSLGSHRVATLNFQRYALESSSIDDFWKIFKQRIKDAIDILKAHKILLHTLTERGLQPFIENGWINMKRLFSTIGILGLVEMQETLEKRFNIDYDIIEEVLIYLNEETHKNSCSDYVFNSEIIPAESQAVKACDINKMLYGKELVPYEMYANQFVPLWENATIWEKLKKDGKYNKLISGGLICHAQVGEKITSEQAKEIINYAVKVGCEHFAINGILSECSNGHNSFGKFTKCPECGADIVEYYTRVVGFLVPVSAMNKTRREWEFPNRTFAKIK